MVLPRPRAHQDRHRHCQYCHLADQQFFSGLGSDGCTAECVALCRAAVVVGRRPRRDILGLKWIEYTIEYREHLLPGLGFAFSGPQSNAVHLFFSFYLVATGLHAVHIAVGIVVLTAVGFRARQNTYNDRYHSPVTVTGLYWHFVDLVWIFLFALIYLPGRSE